MRAQFVSLRPRGGCRATALCSSVDVNPIAQAAQRIWGRGQIVNLKNQKRGCPHPLALADALLVLYHCRANSTNHRPIKHSRCRISAGTFILFAFLCGHEQTNHCKFIRSACEHNYDRNRYVISDVHNGAPLQVCQEKAPAID